MSTHPIAAVASSGCFDPMHPRDIRHVLVGDFYGFYLIRASADPNKAGDGFVAQTIKPVRPAMNIAGPRAHPSRRLPK